MRISLDVDDVLADTKSVLIKYITLIRGKCDWDFNQWEFKEGGISREAFLEIYKLVWHVHNNEIKATINSDEIKEIMKNNDITLVTARDKDDIPPLKRWLKHNFAGIDFKVINTRGIKEKLELDFDIYIDDSPVLLQYKKDHRKLIIVEQPWNKNIRESETVIKVKNLREAIYFLNNLN